MAASTPLGVAFDLGPGPNETRLEVASTVLRPLLRLFDPQFQGLDNVPAHTAALWIGNHTMIGMLDYAVFMLEIFRHKRVKFWSLGDHFHFRVPFWRDLLRENGTFPGTMENCVEVFDNGGNVVIFPGGAREVTKRSGQQNTLLWNDRLGFARLAVRAQVPVVPFACVGGDDWYKIVLDSRQILDSPLGAPLAGILGRLGLSAESYLPSLMRGIGPTLVPRPYPLRFAIAPPVFPSQLDDLGEKDAAVALRDEVRDSVKTLIADLLKVRAEREQTTLGGKIRSVLFGTTVVTR